MVGEYRPWGHKQGNLVKVKKYFVNALEATFLA